MSEAQSLIVASAMKSSIRFAITYPAESVSWRCVVSSRPSWHCSACHLVGRVTVYDVDIRHTCRRKYLVLLAVSGRARRAGDLQRPALSGLGIRAEHSFQLLFHVLAVRPHRINRAGISFFRDQDERHRGSGDAIDLIRRIVLVVIHVQLVARVLLLPRVEFFPVRVSIQAMELEHGHRTERNEIRSILRLHRWRRRLLGGGVFRGYEKDRNSKPTLHESELSNSTGLTTHNRILPRPAFSSWIGACCSQSRRCSSSSRTSRLSCTSGKRSSGASRSSRLVYSRRPLRRYSATSFQRIAPATPRIRYTSSRNTLLSRAKRLRRSVGPPAGLAGAFTVGGVGGSWSCGCIRLIATASCPLNIINASS